MEWDSSNSSDNGHPNLVLAGFMGTGKSTVGRIAAAKMSRPFVDTDSEIEVELGLTVSAIFARHGERAFRRYESDVCRKVAERGGQIIALGGGALLDSANRAALEASGVLVLLTCAPGVLVERLRESAAKGERPLLTGDVEKMTAELLAQRAPLYSSIPLKVDTSYLTPERVAREALALFAGATKAGTEARAI